MTTAQATKRATKLLYIAAPFLHLAWCLVLLVGIVAWRWAEAAVDEALW
jgi:hypothetical protein